MSSNYPVNNERSSSSRPNTARSFTRNITTRIKNFFKKTEWFTNPPTSNSNGLERSIEDDAPEGPPNKRMRYNYPETSVSHTSSIHTRNASTNTDSTEISMQHEAGMVRTPTPSSYSEKKEEKSNISLSNNSFSLSNNNNSVIRKRKALCDSFENRSKAQGSTFYQGETVYGPASTSYMNRPNIKNTKNTHLYDHKTNPDVAISYSTKRICDLLENYSSPLIEAKRILQCTNGNNSEDDTCNIRNIRETNRNSFATKNQELHSPCFASILKCKQKTRLMDTTRAARQLIASQSSSPYNTDNRSSTNQEKESEEVLATNIKTKLIRLDNHTLVREKIPPIEYPLNDLQIDMSNLPALSKFSPKTSCNVREPEINKWFKFSKPENKANDFINIKISPPKWSSSHNNNEILEKEKSMPSSARSIMFTNHENNQKNDSDVTKPLPIVIDIDKWRCPTCMIKNDNSIESCVCCGEKKPKKTESSNSAAVSNSITKPIDINKWRCPACMVQNDNSIISCVCCGEKIPKKTECPNTAVVSDSITKVIGLNKWRCPRYLLDNDDSFESCIGSDEKKPKKAESITKPNISFSNQNMSITASTLSTTLVDSKKDKWDCPGCYVRNEKNVNKCVCCETNKPGLSGITQNKGFNFNQTNKNTFKFGINPKDYTKPEKPTIEVAIFNQDNNFSKPNEADTHNKFTSTVTTVVATGLTVVPASVTPAVAVVTSAPVASAAPVSTATPVASEAPEVSVAPVATEAPEVSVAPVATEAPEVSVAPVASATPEVSVAPVASATPEVSVTPVATAVPISAVATTLTASVLPTSFLPTSADATIGIDNNEKQMSILPESSQKPYITIATGPANIPVFPLSAMQPAMSATFMNNKDSLNNEFQMASTSNQAQNNFSFSTAPPQGIQPVVTPFSPPTSSSSPFSNIQVSARTSASNVSQISYASNPVTTSLSFFQTNNLISTPAPSTSSLFERSETIKIGASNAVVSNPSVFSFGNNTQNSQPQSGSSKFNFNFSTNNPERPSIFNSQPFGSNNIESNNTFNLAVPSGNGLSGNTGLMNIIQPGNGLSTGNPVESISRGNGVVTMSDETTSNPMISGNNLLGDHSSSSTAPSFHAQMNRDVWPTSNTGSNSFSFNARFSSPNSLPAPAGFGDPSGPSATAFGIAPQMPTNLSQNMFVSQSSANSSAIFGAPRMPSTVVPTATSFENRNFGNPNIFKFGVGGQTNSAVFGQPQVQTNQPLMYNFGGNSNGMVPQVQFNMGSSAGIPARRVRKAIRRISQR